MSQLDEPRAQVAGSEPGSYSFTLHVDLVARDEDQALLRAEQYVQALNVLGRGVDRRWACVSATGDWAASVGVLCNATGPLPTDVCLSRFGHDGGHRGTGPTGSWADDEAGKS
jgi:hypothetical protein